MAAESEHRYRISEVSSKTEVPPYVLRQWEASFPRFLKPGRDRANRRYYTEYDIRVVQRIKELLWEEKMTTEGARTRLGDEIRKWGSLRSRRELTDLVDKIEAEVRGMLELLSPE
jgi:DNA-binding transcriptional MerR regulator